MTIFHWLFQTLRPMSRALVDKQHPEISMRRQSKLLGVARSTITCRPMDEDLEGIRIKRRLDEIYMRYPRLGSRRLETVLERDHGITTDRKRVARLRREIGQETIWCKPRTRIPDEGHRKYAYLLRRDGLAFAQGAGLGAFQHHEHRSLPRDLGKSPGCHGNNERHDQR